MTLQDMNTSTPDHGEPWTIQEGHLSTSLFDGKGAYFADIERSNAEVVVVDYLQLMEDTSARKSDTREGVLASISRRQKRLARRTGKVILTASQLNDGGKLRESRAIGQDADKVMMLKKHADDNSETGFDDGKRNLWCEKNRGGRRHWELPLLFLGSIFQFREP